MVLSHLWNQKKRENCAVPACSAPLLYWVGFGLKNELFRDPWNNCILEEWILKDVLNCSLIVTPLTSFIVSSRALRIFVHIESTLTLHSYFGDLVIITWKGILEASYYCDGTFAKYLYIFWEKIFRDFSFCFEQFQVLRYSDNLPIAVNAGHRSIAGSPHNKQYQNAP